MRFNHIGIPTTTRFDGGIDLPHLKMTVSDHENNPFGIQWQRYWAGAPYPDLVKEVAHVAFEVDDLEEALKGQTVIISPNSPSRGLTVAFIEVNGAPVELMELSGDTPDTNRGFHGSDDEVVAQAINSQGGFTMVLAGLKAWLEHGIALNLVADHAPDTGVPESREPAAARKSRINLPCSVGELPLRS